MHKEEQIWFLLTYDLLQKEEDSVVKERFFHLYHNGFDLLVSKIDLIVDCYRFNYDDTKYSAMDSFKKFYKEHFQEVKEILLDE